MKLEPSRPTLSGRPEFLRPQAPLQTSAIVVAPRKCVACGIGDSAQDYDGEVHHVVELELQYIKDRAALTPFLMSKGWRYKFHQGRHAMERDICTACLKAREEMRKEFDSKRAREMRSQNQDGYYMAVCGE